MSAPNRYGRPARELSDEELEQQGTHAHETRNWVFLHGTAEQFATHTSRMLELEQEYLRRYPKRTWQGSGGASAERAEVDVLREALRAVIRQLEALLDRPAPDTRDGPPPADPVTVLLQQVAAAPGGRMHKLEVHQAAREVGLDRAGLAALYTADEPLLTADKQDRVITDAALARLADRRAP